MAFPCLLSSPDWTLLRQMAREGQFSFGVALIDKIKGGDRRWTEDNALEVHRISNGVIPCWKVRPDLWGEGYIPPCLAA